MKKSYLLKSGAALVLSTALLTGALSGCSFGSGNTAGTSPMNEATQGSKDYVFRSEKLDFLPEADYSNLSMVGDRIYASTYSDGDYIKIISFDPDGNNISTVKIPESENQGHGNMVHDKEGNLYCVMYDYYYTDQNGEVITYHGQDPDEASEEASDAKEPAVEGNSADEPEATGADADKPAADGADADKPEANGADAQNQETGDAQAEGESDDKMAVISAEDVYEEPDGEYHEDQYLLKYDPQGKELLKVNLAEDLPEDDYFSLYSMIYDDEFGLILSTNHGIKKLNEADGSFSMILDNTDSSSEYYQVSISLYRGFDGTMYASLWGQNGMELRTFDPATGKFGESSQQFTTFEDYSFFEGNGYDIYVSKSDGFYGYESNGDKIIKILDYTDSDIGVNYALNTVIALSDSEFIANIPDEEYNYSLYRLTKVPADQVKDKTIITLGGNSIDYNVRQMVYKFNHESDGYKIKLVDYSTLATDEDWNAGATQFNLDIVSGNVPDIMVFSMDEPVDSYINKGLFLDIMPFIKDDPDLKDTAFVTNVFDAFKTGDKLYQLVPSFYVNTVITKSSYMKGQDILSLKDCKDMIEGKGVNYVDSFGMTDRDTILYYGLLTSGNRFIDWENKKCNFDSDEFVELLEFANKYPAQITEDMWMEYDEGSYRTGKSLFTFAYLNGFRPYNRYKEGVYGEDISMIGFPNEMGINCSIITPNIRLAISSQSKYSDQCWKILRQFLMKDYQNGIGYDFPITREGFEKLAKDSMEREFWLDDDGKKHYEDDYYWIGDTQIVIPPCDQEDVDTVRSFVESLSLVYSPNQNVTNIVNEEASAFFSGQKSAKEVADIIQSRLSIYVNENS